MNFRKVLFISTISGILFLLFLAQSTEPTTFGKIEKITYSSNKITLNLEGKNEPFVLFGNLPPDIKKGDDIQIKFSKDTYKNQKQFLVTKIEKIGQK